MDDHLGLNAPSTAGIWQNKYHPSLIFPYNALLKGNNSSALLQEHDKSRLDMLYVLFFLICNIFVVSWCKS